MFKLKTIKSLSKRLKITAHGKLLRRQSGRNHLLSKKSSKHKTNLSKVALVSLINLRNYKHLLVLRN